MIAAYALPQYRDGELDGLKLILLSHEDSQGFHRKLADALKTEVVRVGGLLIFRGPGERHCRYKHFDPVNNRGDRLLKNDVMAAGPLWWCPEGQTPECVPSEPL